MEAAPGVVLARILPWEARYHGGFGKIEKVQKISWAEQLARRSGVNLARGRGGFRWIFCLRRDRAGKLRFGEDFGVSSVIQGATSMRWKTILRG